MKAKTPFVNRCPGRSYGNCEVSHFETLIGKSFPGKDLRQKWGMGSLLTRLEYQKSFLNRRW